MITPTVTISPTTYKGWNLSYRDDHQNRNNWSGRKSGDSVFADTPQLLLAAIDEHEQVTARLNPPIKALVRGKYSSSFVPCVIHSVCRHQIYYTEKNGKENVSLLDYLKPGNTDSHRDLFIHDTKGNHALLAKGVKLMKQSSLLKKQAEELTKSVKCVLDADILIAAKKD